MKHSEVRALVLAAAFIIIILSAFYFDSYKHGGPIILIPLSFIERGFLLFIAGLVVVFDSFFISRRGFKKRKSIIMDKPFGIALFYIFVGLISIISGILLLFNGNYGTA